MLFQNQSWAGCHLWHSNGIRSGIREPIPGNSPSVAAGMHGFSLQEAASVVACAVEGLYQFRRHPHARPPLKSPLPPVQLTCQIKRRSAAKYSMSAAMWNSPDSADPKFPTAAGEAVP